MDSPLLCPNCQNILTPDMLFCPKCGVKIKEPELSVSIGKQIGVYALSFFLPPLGLWPGIKYYKQASPATKRVGIIAIGLTLVSIILSLWFSFAIYNQFAATFQQYQNIETIQ